MSKTNIIKTEVFVLKTFPYSDSSLIVRFFSKDIGRQSFIAKGIKKSKKSISAIYEPFSHLDITIYIKESSDLATLKEAHLINSYYFIRESLETLSLASFLFEVVDKASFSSSDNILLFNVISNYMKNLEQNAKPIFWTEFCLFKIIGVLGFLPNISSCGECGKINEQKKFYLNIFEGNTLCDECFKTLADTNQIKFCDKKNYIDDENVSKALCFLSSASETNNINFNLSMKQHKKIFDIIIAILKFNLETNFQSTSFLEKILNV